MIKSNVETNPSCTMFIKYLFPGKFETCLIEVSNKGPWILHKDGDKASLDKVNVFLRSLCSNTMSLYFS